MILIDENKKRAIRAMIEPGTKVGRLTVLSLDCGSYSYDRKYLCQCECGNTKIVEETPVDYVEAVKLLQKNRKECAEWLKGKDTFWIVSEKGDRDEGNAKG